MSSPRWVPQFRRRDPAGIIGGTHVLRRDVTHAPSDARAPEWYVNPEKDRGGFEFREDFTVCTDCEVFIKPESSTINLTCIEHVS